ncbi:unnamed protein product [Ostreobium quekettii]|uniref:tRNA-specific adenosine deaminase 1 n=1 Tax=Ostreobium quekettii TaxID=121088 RepID=A0A8S1J985_9CHLO|nr:unnamed protein product [Ostreobium quekettii]
MDPARAPEHSDAPLASPEADPPSKRRRTGASALPDIAPLVGASANAISADCDHAFALAVAESVTGRFRRLPKTGKPQAHEATILAGICVTTGPWGPGSGIGRRPLAVALGTGTKCLAASRRCAEAVGDAHAEVVARRAFLCWVLDEMERASPRATDGAEGGDGPPGRGTETGAFLYDASTGKFDLREGVRFHMFVSQPPCGDASIFALDPTTGGWDGGGKEVDGLAGSQTVNEGMEGTREGRYSRTGAKVIGASFDEVSRGRGSLEALLRLVPAAADVEDAAGPQATGVLRRKPGRGDRTLSMSCSDKMARWGLVGLQKKGMMGILRAPLTLSSVVVAMPQGAGSAAEMEAGREALARALVGRVQTLAPRLRPPFRWSPPSVFVVAPLPTDLPFAAIDERRVPSGFAINWSAETRLVPSSTADQTLTPPTSPSVHHVPSERPVPHAYGGEHHADSTTCMNPLATSNRSSDMSPGADSSQPATTTLQNSRVPNGCAGYSFKVAGCVHEVTLGVTGRKAGMTHKTAARSSKSTSRICRAVLSERIGQLRTKGAATMGDRYGRHCDPQQEQWLALLKPLSPIEGWIRKPESDPGCTGARMEGATKEHQSQTEQ